MLVLSIHAKMAETVRSMLLAVPTVHAPRELVEETAQKVLLKYLILSIISDGY